MLRINILWYGVAVAIFTLVKLLANSCCPTLFYPRNGKFGSFIIVITM